MLALPLTGKVLGAGSENFVIAEWRDPGGPPGQRRLIAPFHVHLGDDEAWYVLEGRLCVWVGEQEVEAPAGSAVIVPRGTVHTYWNPGSDPVRYLLVMTPNIHRLIQDIHAMTVRTPEALAKVFESHDSALVPEPPGF